MKTFKELGLSNEIVAALEELHFKEPTEIQEKVIPIALTGKDIIGGSATGSGKTLAFGAAILEKIKRGNGVQALILTPTRELTEQVSKSLTNFSKNSHLKIVTIYGGVSINPQIEALRRADIVVGTPGRVLDHIDRRTINLSKVEFLVLDEADRMLDMGFFHDVTKIINHCPKKRQTLLFSATISRDILSIADRYMDNPVEVSVESYVDPSKLEQVFYDVPQKEKFSLLVHLLKQENSKLVMVFCNTKRNADVIGRNLVEQGFDALALHGDLSQNQRNRVLEEFHKSDKFVLVCTDVAARGLDIKNVSHVYNYDCAKTSTEYIHRIGRTARAGKDGKAITILSRNDYDNFSSVIRDDSLKIKEVPLPEFEKLFVRMSGDTRHRSFGRGNRDGGRSYGRDRGDRGSRGGREFRGRREHGSRRGGRSFGNRSRSRDSRTHRRSERRY